MVGLTYQSKAYISVTVYPVSCKFGNNIWTNIPHVSINVKPIYCRDFKSYLEIKNWMGQPTTYTRIAVGCTYKGLDFPVLSFPAHIEARMFNRLFLNIFGRIAARSPYIETPSN